MSTIQANHHAEMLELPSKDKSNDVFSPAVWRALAAEYLVWNGVGYLDNQARRDAYKLLDHVKGYAFPYGTPSIGAVECPGNVGVAPTVWYPVPDADPYKDFADMDARYMQANRHMFVSDEYCDDHPVFSHSDNVLFRAWHDAGHLAYGLGFSANDEVELFTLSASKADRSGYVMAEGARRALFSESIYQLAAAHVLGGFPDRQTVAPLGPVGTRVYLELLAG
jgi:hypothetical protein